MKKYGFVLLAVLFVAAVAAAQYGAPAKPQEPMQKEPYTATSFGPWNAEVATVHVPMVTFEKTAMGLKVTVQIDNHPMDAQKPHWIEWIRIEDMTGKKLAEKKLKPTDPGPPTAVFELKGTYDKLKVLEHCNVHGTWLNEATVEMK